MYLCSRVPIPSRSPFSEGVPERAASGGAMAAARDARAAVGESGRDAAHASPQRAACTHLMASKFASGKPQLAAVIAKKRWPDGRPVGRGHASPYLQPQYAAAIADGRKKVEGRPGGGWVQPGGGRALAPDDYIRFKVVGHAEGLCARVTRVTAYATFAAMIGDVGVQALLPDADGADFAGAVAKYRAFANRRGVLVDERVGARAERVPGTTVVRPPPRRWPPPRRPMPPSAARRPAPTPERVAAPL